MVKVRNGWACLSHGLKSEEWRVALSLGAVPLRAAERGRRPGSVYDGMTVSSKFARGRSLSARLAANFPR